MSLSPADFLAVTRDDERIIMPKTNDGFTDRVLQLADELVTYMVNELQGGSEWYRRWDSLSDKEKKALYKCIADGFNDSTNE